MKLHVQDIILRINEENFIYAIDLNLIVTAPRKSWTLEFGLDTAKVSKIFIIPDSVECSIVNTARPDSDLSEIGAEFSTALAEGVLVALHTDLERIVSTYKTHRPQLSDICVSTIKATWKKIINLKLTAIGEAHGVPEEPVTATEVS